MRAALLTAEMDVARRLAREAGRILLEVWAGAFQVEHKPHEGGPVTDADRRANAFLVEELRRAFPGDGVVAEESPDLSDARRYDRCWFIDPLDGTREFVERVGQFAVHVGLAIEGEARLGVVYRPDGDRLWAGVVGGGASVLDAQGERPVHVRSVTEPSSWRLVVSRSHRSRKTEAIKQLLGVGSVAEMGSVGLKCGMLAEGLADLYIHPGDRCWRWDSCAPEAVLRAAGGVLVDLAGNPYRYDGTEMRDLRGLLGATAAAYPVVQPIVERVAREAGLVP